MLKKYEMELDELKHPLMVEEGSYECPDERLNCPEKIVRLLNECFRLDKKAEEYVYMLAFDAKCNPLGVFELGHGSVNACILNPREIFQRALICGAVNIVIAHNHPSHDTTPSKDDDIAASKISEAGKLMKIQLVDFIIIGNGYFSYAEEKRNRDIKMNLIVSFSFLWAAPPRLICLHPDSHFTRCVLCRICHTNKSVAKPPTVGTAIVFIPYLTTLLETDVDIFVFIHPRSFFKLCFLICWKVCFFAPLNH